MSRWKIRSTLEISLCILSIFLFLIVLLLATSLIYLVLKPSTCTNPSCIKAASRFLETIDESKDPCNDFYNFACGKYLKTAYENNKTAEVYMMDSKAKRQYEALFREPLHKNDSRYFRNLKLLYGACINQTEIKNNGLGYMKNILKQLGGWPIIEGPTWDDTGFDWINMTVELRKHGYFYNIFVSFHIFEEANVTKRHYLKLDCPIVKEIGTKTHFEHFITSVANLFGVLKEQTSHEAKQMFEFAAELLKIQKNYVNDLTDTEGVSLLTINDIQKMSPHINWLEFINAIVGLGDFNGNSEIVFNITTYMENINNLLNTTPKRVQANYILWETVKETIVFLPAEFQERLFEYSKSIFLETSKFSSPSEFGDRSYIRNSLGKASSDIAMPVKLPRSTICQREVQKLLPSVADRIYAEKFAPPELRNLVIDVVASMKQEFKILLSKNKWMDDDTKKYAMDKLDSMKQFIGGNYIDTTPELIEEQMIFAYVNLDDEENYISMIAKCRIATNNYYFTIIKKSPEETKILSYYHFVSKFNAFYSSLNTIFVPAALLQDMLFDKDFPNYLNYGGFGHVIGHEITHAFTKMSNQYGRIGEDLDWWSNTTKDNYNNITSCLVSTYEDYTLQKIGIKLNGTSTLNENIADLTGTLVAYELYNKLAANDPKLIGLENYTQRQLFWISTARFYCDPEESKIKHHDMLDLHSLSSFRVIGPFSNIKHFAEDFNCPVGSQMNPTIKCEIF